MIKRLAMVLTFGALQACGGLEPYTEDDGSIDTTAEDGSFDSTADGPLDSSTDVPFDSPLDGDVTDSGWDTDSHDPPVDTGTEDVAIDPADPCASFPTIPCVLLPHGASDSIAVDIVMDVESADIYLLVDTTGSMDATVSALADDFSTDIAGPAAATFSDVRFGVGHFNDFPTGEYGHANDLPFWHVLDFSSATMDVSTSLASLVDGPWGSGWDLPEANATALYLTATGEGIDAGGATIPARTCTDPFAIGYPCFRRNALSVVAMVTDAPWHNGPGDSDPYSFTAPTFSDATSAFIIEQIWFLGVYIDTAGTDALTYLESFAEAVGSVDDLGNPLVSSGNATSVAGRTASLIDALADEVMLDVGASAEDVPGDPPGDERDATVFVTAITPSAAVPPAGDPVPAFDSTTFFDVRQGTTLKFDVALQNTTYTSGATPVASMVWIVASNADRTEVGRRQIVVIVP